MICVYFILLFGGVLGGVIDYHTGATGGSGCYGIPGTAKAEFNYDYSGQNPHILGPYDWGKSYPECNKYSQSPILLPTVFADMPFLDRLEYEGWRDNNFEWQLVNSGGVLCLHVPDNLKNIPSVTTLAGEFLLHSIIIRVGASGTGLGSEHGMNGRLYPGEAQKYFYSSEYKDFWEASKVPGKVAMVSHLLERTEEDNAGFNGLIENLYNINGTSNPFNLDWYSQVFFQEDGKKCNNCDYFFYEGSLDFPPCSETALWFVMMQTTKISERQLNVFRSVINPNTNKPLVNNYRVAQPANFRDILQHREQDYKSYENFQPPQPPMMPPPGAYYPGAYPPGVRPPPEGAYPPMMPPAYRQDSSDSTTGGQPAYPPLPPLYPNYPLANDHYPSPYPPPPSHYSAPTTPPTTTTTTEKPSYRYQPAESPYPDYNPRVDTHAHQQYPYPRYPQQHQHRHG